MLVRRRDARRCVAIKKALIAISIIRNFFVLQTRSQRCRRQDRQLPSLTTFKTAPCESRSLTSQTSPSANRLGNRRSCMPRLRLHCVRPPRCTPPRGSLAPRRTPPDCQSVLPMQHATAFHDRTTAFRCRRSGSRNRRRNPGRWEPAIVRQRPGATIRASRSTDPAFADALSCRATVAGLASRNRESRAFHIPKRRGRHNARTRHRCCARAGWTRFASRGLIPSRRPDRRTCLDKRAAV